MALLARFSTSRLNPARVLAVVTYAIVGGVALAVASPWVALLAALAAARAGPRLWRWPLRALALALAGVTIARVPFAEGQALLSDFVFPFTLVAAAAMAPPAPTTRFWHTAVAVTAALFLLGGARHDQALAGEVGAALCLVLGGLRE
jgi:hypothetical protein